MTVINPSDSGEVIYDPAASVASSATHADGDTEHSLTVARPKLIALGVPAPSPLRSCREVVRFG